MFLVQGTIRIFPKAPRVDNMTKYPIPHLSAGQALAALLLIVSLLIAPPATSPAFAAQKYTCPMHPHYIANAPGSCPICGMDLVPMADVDADEANPDTDPPEGGTDDGADANSRAAITISPETIWNIGVRAEQAAMVRFGAAIRSYGVVTENARNTHVISGRVAGWIEALSITAVGDEVKKGDLLLYLVPSCIDSKVDGNFIIAWAGTNKEGNFAMTFNQYLRSWSRGKEYGPPDVGSLTVRAEQDSEIAREFEKRYGNYLEDYSCSAYCNCFRVSSTCSKSCGAECETNNDCQSGYFCDSNCGCVVTNSLGETIVCGR